MATADSIRLLINSVSEETSSYFRASESESDRGHALVSVAHLDNMVKIILANAFIEDAKIKKQVFSRQLHSFSAKIDLAYGLGFIDKNIKEELDILRSIRNHFAHSFRECSFDDPPVRQDVVKLRFAVRVDATSSREIFSSSVFTTLLILLALAEQIATPKPRDELNPDGAGFAAIIETLAHQLIRMEDFENMLSEIEALEQKSE